jgi:hypothetical protein
MNGSGKCGVYTQWSISQPERKMKLVICRNMDGTGDHHKPDAERQTSHLFSHVQNLDP